MKTDRPKNKKHHIIYKTTCLITGKWYIGMHSTDNLDDGYQGSGTHLWFSIRKHGKECHETEILEHCVDRSSLILREKELVNEETLKHELCMNLMTGGSAGPEFKKPTTEETSKKISKNSKAMWDKRKAEGYIPPPQKPEHVAKRAAGNTGKTRTEEQRKNLLAGQERYYKTIDHEILAERAKKSHVTRKENGSASGGRPKGIAMSAEQKVAQSLNMKGKPSNTNIRASCLHCRKETTLGAIKQFHRKCKE